MGQKDIQNDYIVPENYVETKTLGERLTGTLQMDVDVVEEIERRTDLDNEARKVLFTMFGLLSVLRMLLVFMTDLFTNYNALGTIIEILLEFILVNYIFVLSIASIGKRIGGSKTSVDDAEIIRVLSYAFGAYVISELLNFLSEFAFILILPWLASVIYAALVFTYAVKRSLDGGWGPAVMTVILAYIAKFIMVLFLYQITGFVFGDTYS